MDKQLFSQQGENEWEVIDTMVFQFFNVTLAHSIGRHDIGSEFHLAEIDYGRGTLTLYADDGTSWRYPLSLTVCPYRLPPQPPAAEK